MEVVEARDCNEAAKIICRGIGCGEDDGVAAGSIRIESPKVLIEGIRFKSPQPADVADISKVSEKLRQFVRNLVENKKSFSTSDGNGGQILWRFDKSEQEKEKNRSPYGVYRDDEELESESDIEQEPALNSEVKNEPVLKLGTNPDKMLETRSELVAKLLAGLKVIGHKKVRVGEIRPFKNQPREFFDEVKLDQLAGSIKYGQRQDIILMQLKKPDGKIKFELIDGERRWRSARKAGEQFLEAKIYEAMSEKQQFLFSAISNFGREGHTELEEVKTIARTKKDFGLNETELAAIYSKSQTWVSQRLALLRLDLRVMEMMKMNGGKRLLDFSTALVLSGIADHERQYGFAREIIEKGLTLNQAKHLIRNRAMQEGFKMTMRKRKPKDDYNNLTGFLKRTINDALIYADIMPEKAYLALFKSRNMAERDEATRSFRKVIKMMEVLIERMSMLD